MKEIKTTINHTNIPTDELPSFCKDHPSAQILHEWDQAHYVMNGYPAGSGISKNHRYGCSICGLEVCSPEEYERRRNHDRNN